MRVIEVTRFGGPEVLQVREAPEPVAGPGEVVVEVAVAPVLFLDTALRRGLGREYFPLRPPYVAGSGVAGRVVAAGAASEAGWLGRRVISDTGPSGGNAERTAVSAEDLVAVPDGLELTAAAALLHDGRTAFGLAEAAALRAGQRVLVLGASGGMGTLLVQVAHAAGATVVGAARGERKLDLIRELGADAAVDYSKAGWPERVREATGATGPDVVFDGVGGEIGRAGFAITARGGHFSAHGTPSGEFTVIAADEAEDREITMRGISDVQFSPAERKRLLERALLEAQAGRIRAVIGQTFTLERAGEAHAAIEGRRVFGKTLLIADSSSDRSPERAPVTLL